MRGMFWHGLVLVARAAPDWMSFADVDFYAQTWGNTIDVVIDFGLCSQNL